MPGSNRTAEEREAFKAFNGTVESDTAEALEARMGEAEKLIKPAGKFAAGDRLIIESSGPHLPLLTLIDLPGLVRIENDKQDAEDIRVIEELSDSYMKNPNTIILAVIGGNNDFVQAIILKKAVKWDPKGLRTIGVLTKPDLTEARAYTQIYIDLITGKDENTKYHFKLGWYVVLNPGPHRNPTKEEMKRIETDFFSSGEWGSLPSSMRGADSLTAHLSLQLQKAIVKRLNIIRQQIDAADEVCDANLESLGNGLDSPEKMARELNRLFKLSNDLVIPAIHGTYQNPMSHSFSWTRRIPREPRCRICGLESGAKTRHLQSASARSAEKSGLSTKKATSTSAPRRSLPKLR